MSQQWLVRTEKNRILGPFTREVLQGMVRSGQLAHQDEICESARFWIALHDRQEVLEHLGVELPRPTEASAKAAEAEVNRTRILDLSAKDEKTDPHLVLNSNHSGLINGLQDSRGIQRLIWGLKYVVAPAGLIYAVFFLEKLLGSK